MTAGSGRDDFEPADALDRAIDEALRAEMRAHAIDLRERVLVRLDESDDVQPAWWKSLILRPALLPAAGAALLVVGVALTWQHVDRTLERIGTRQPVARVAVAKPHAPTARTANPRDRQAATSQTFAAAPGPASRPRATGPRIAAASVLDMDALGAPVPVAGDTLLPSDEIASGQVMPGAMAGDLGDPITPIPPLRPIVIRPIATAPIVQAPPVSTLAPAVEIIPTVGDLTRDPSGPGKPGGVRQ